MNNKDYLNRLKIGLEQNRNFIFITDFQEVLSLTQPSNHKS